MTSEAGWEVKDRFYADEPIYRITCKIHLERLIAQDSI